RRFRPTPSVPDEVPRAIPFPSPAPNCCTCGREDTSTPLDIGEIRHTHAVRHARHQAGCSSSRCKSCCPGQCPSTSRNCPLQQSRRNCTLPLRRRGLPRKPLACQQCRDRQPQCPARFPALLHLLAANAEIEEGKVVPSLSLPSN